MFEELLAIEGEGMARPQLLKIPGTYALAEIQRQRGEFSNTGLYPILLGDAEDFERIGDGLEESFDPADVLAESRRIVPDEWFRQRPESDPELYQFEEGEWPAERCDEMGIITHLDIPTKRPKQEVLIGLLRLNSPWESFAHLNWGGWNDCPFPAEHCAIHRYWADRYGAEVVSITSDVVQCTVARPPTDKAASLRLAREQYIYCYDIVEQGTQTIAALAAGLLNSTTWYFWWD